MDSQQIINHMNIKQVAQNMIKTLDETRNTQEYNLKCIETQELIKEIRLIKHQVQGRYCATRANEQKSQQQGRHAELQGQRKLFIDQCTVAIDMLTLHIQDYKKQQKKEYYRQYNKNK